MLPFSSCCCVIDEKLAIWFMKAALSTGSSGVWFFSCVVSSVRKVVSWNCVLVVPSTPPPVMEPRPPTLEEVMFACLLDPEIEPFGRDVALAVQRRDRCLPVV